MKIPINYALNYPVHSNLEIDSLDLSKISQLTFEKPDLDKFKCIKLAYKALEMGGTATAALNIANDFLVDLFLNEKISFIDIPKYIEYVMDKHPHSSNPSLEEIYNLMDWIKNFLIKEIKI